MSANNTSSLVTMLRRHEGVRPKVYKDSLGIETVGVGLNLRRPDARQRLKDVGADYEKVLAGVAALSDEQINALLMLDIADCLADLGKLFADFVALPDAAQRVLIDMRFQLGGAGLRAFKNTLTAFRERRWKDAAFGMRASLAYKQAHSRWEENAALVEALAA